MRSQIKHDSAHITVIHDWAHKTGELWGVFVMILETIDC